MSNNVNYVVTTDITPKTYTTTAASIYPMSDIFKCNRDKKMYLSGDFCLNGKKVYIREVMYNDPATIIFWNDGTKTVAKCHDGDIYSKETGLSICILKKLVGATKVHNVFEDWIPDDEGVTRVTIKDVRKKFKEKQYDSEEEPPMLAGGGFLAGETPIQTEVDDLSFIDVNKLK